MYRKKVTISRAVVPSSKVIISFYESDWNLGPEPRVKSHDIISSWDKSSIVRRDRYSKQSIDEFICLSY